VRIALGLEYDGSGFCGWQSQPGGCGVQDALEQALAAIAGEPVGAVTAGRTDTGVHALGQVVHFDTGAERPDSAWVRGVNAHLPRSVAVTWARRVDDQFHARFSALERRYVYVLLNRPSRPGLMWGKVGWYHAPLDLDAMRAGACHLIGEHDFSAFRAAECQAKTPVKILRELEIFRSGEFLLFHLRANAFLHHMVRNLIGSLVYVGKGKHPPEWIKELLEHRDRRQAAPTFAPDGLYLAGVGYEAKWKLPEEKGLPGFAGGWQD
jgi:tRNA pseudouridine38-40 synthase